MCQLHADRLGPLDRPGPKGVGLDDGTWYRFHSLMAALLRARLRREEPALARHLHQLAAQEGQVNVYTSLSSTVTKPLQAAWAKAYPDVKLSLYRASSEDVTARVLAETSAGTSGADIIETNGTNMLIFQHKANVLIPYQKSPYAGVIPKKYRFDTFTADRLEEFVVAWNTNLVKDPPKSFQELATSKWAGKLSVEPTDADWFAQLYIYFTQMAKQKMTTKQADAMFAGVT